ncbi:hypothetical protein EJ02DRAFT_93115 [Clathrospora elynae]|uniref:Uncharacterized protein n=1 Tax=Clathrospora elynae TaxID=706981 RepID=A0A6A5SX86_9PLEO|nr:hypothetical protein EJ02DRAFT_93115 [Clathrospora elynae]
MLSSAQCIYGGLHITVFWVAFTAIIIALKTFENSRLQNIGVSVALLSYTTYRPACLFGPQGRFHMCGWCPRFQAVGIYHLVGRDLVKWVVSKRVWVSGFFGCIVISSYDAVMILRSHWRRVRFRFAFHFSFYQDLRDTPEERVAG